jgi:hypothetical protein
MCTKRNLLLDRCKLILHIADGLLEELFGFFDMIKDSIEVCPEEP